MKPCSKNRKRIAWLALDALDTHEATSLRAHLAQCEGCRRYWQEMSNTTDRLTTAMPVSNLEASESFHRKLAEKLQSNESGSVLENLATWIRGPILNWRVAFPAIAFLSIALFAIVVPQRHLTSSQPAPPITSAQVLPSSDPASDLAPTLGNYQMIANQSLEKLSELLTEQGNKSLPPAPTYTLSSFQLANTSF